MTSVSIAAEWQLLADRYYRKLELYPLRCPAAAAAGSVKGGVAPARVDLASHIVACAPFGGPIAAVRDDSKLVQLASEPSRRRLLILSSSGHLLASSHWDHRARLVALSWSSSLTLAALLDDGSLLRFDLRASPIGSAVSVLGAASGACVADFAFWANGVAVLTDDGRVFCVPDLSDPRPRQLADPRIGDTDPVLCMAVIEPQFVMSGGPEVLLAVGDRILAVEEDGIQDLGQDLGIGPVQRMAVSPNGKLLAAFAHDGRLLVLTTDFSRIIFEQECESTLPPEQIAWCGLDSVLLYWDENETLLMVGPDGDPVNYTYEEPIKLIPECDGVRILSNSSMEFLHRVPDSTVSIFGIGSTSPAALLFDAYDLYVKGSAKADENLRLVRSSLPEAIENCIDAAGHEFDLSRQLTLMKAASYGLSFASQFPRERYPEMSKMLRVLNAVRGPDIGIPLSIQQYKLLTAPVLIGRLTNAYQHMLALRISEYLNLNPELVVLHWACEKITVSSATQDAELLEDLLHKLRLCKGISYAAIATHADNCGRRKLAAMLVDKESQYSKQVPLLLRIEEDEKALTKAIESGDPDLIYLVLFHIWPKKVAPDFFGIISSRPVARDLFITYSRFYKPEFLKDFFLATGQFQDVAFLVLKESQVEEKVPLGANGSPLNRRRIKLIESGQKLFADTKEQIFESKCAEEYAKLIRLQQELEVQLKRDRIVGTSISDTIRICIAVGNHRAANKVKLEFKVPEKRWYWLKALSMALANDWDGLEKFSKEKRPPAGYKPFVEACIIYEAKNEALKYIPKLVDPRERSEAYARIGMAKEATEAASQSKDSDELFGRLKFTFAQNSATSSIFNTLRDQLSFREPAP